MANLVRARLGPNAPSEEHYFVRRYPRLRCWGLIVQAVLRTRGTGCATGRTHLVEQRIAVVDSGISRWPPSFHMNHEDAREWRCVSREADSGLPCFILAPCAA